MAADGSSETKSFEIDCRALGLEPPPTMVSINWPKSWAGRRVSLRVPYGSLEAVLAWAAPLRPAQISILVHPTGISLLFGTRSPPAEWDRLPAELRGAFARLHADGQVVLWLHGDAELIQVVGDSFHGTAPAGADRSFDPFTEQETESVGDDARSLFGLPARAGAPSAATPGWNGGAPEQDGPRLTRRQDLVLRESIRMGYYELPRRVHLRDIAKKLGTSVASLAEVLRRAETRLAERYATTPSPEETDEGEPAAARARARQSGTSHGIGGELRSGSAKTSVSPPRGAQTNPTARRMRDDS